MRKKVAKTRKIVRSYVAPSVAKPRTRIRISSQKYPGQARARGATMKRRRRRKGAAVPLERRRVCATRLVNGSVGRTVSRIKNVKVKVRASHVFS